MRSSRHAPFGALTIFIFPSLSSLHRVADPCGRHISNVARHTSALMSPTRSQPLTSCSEAAPFSEQMTYNTHIASKRGNVKNFLHSRLFLSRKIAFNRLLIIVKLWYIIRKEFAVRRKRRKNGKLYQMVARSQGRGHMRSGPADGAVRRRDDIDRQGKRRVVLSRPRV